MPDSKPSTTVAPPDPNGPETRPFRLERLIAQPEDIEFITIPKEEAVTHASPEGDNAETTAPPEPPAETIRK